MVYSLIIYILYILNTKKLQNANYFTFIIINYRSLKKSKIQNSMSGGYFKVAKIQQLYGMSEVNIIRLDCVEKGLVN